MIRLLPMFVTGIICNFIIAVVIERITLVWIVGEQYPIPQPQSTFNYPSG